MTMPSGGEGNTDTPADTAQETASGGDDSTAPSATTGRTIVTRRRLLAAGGASAGLLGGGVGYVYRELQTEYDVLDAPEQFPTLSTRDAFDSQGNERALGEAVTPELSGDWAAVGDDDSIVLFVHGWGTGHDGAKDQAYTTQQGLLEAGEQRSVAAFSWDADRSWGIANDIAGRNGVALARFLAAANRGPRVHLVGYSLGARVSCVCLQQLRQLRRLDSVASVSLLGGAIPYESVEAGGQYGDAIAAAPVVANFHSDRDRVLGWLYRLAERTRAVGYGGARQPDETAETYTDIDVSAHVGDHTSYYHPSRGCLPQLVETVF